MTTDNFLDRWKKESWRNRWLFWKEYKKLQLQCWWETKIMRNKNWKDISSLRQ